MYGRDISSLAHNWNVGMLEYWKIGSWPPARSLRLGEDTAMLGKWIKIVLT
jgi:hypothetical protein